MAQFFQVLDSVENQGEEQQQQATTYSNIVDNQGVHYIIQTTDANQTYVLDNVMEQPAIQQMPQQQFFLVSSPQKDPNMQPVVLNHQLQQKVLIPQIQQQQQQQSVVAPPPLRQIPRAPGDASAQIRNRMLQPRNATVGLPQRAPRVGVQPALRLRARLTSNGQVGVLNRPRPPVGGQQQESVINGVEMVKLPDGRIMPIGDYQKILEDRRLQEQQPQPQQTESRLLNSNPMRTPRVQMPRQQRPGPPRLTTRQPLHSSPQGQRPNLLNQNAPRPPPIIPEPPAPKKITSRILAPNQAARLPRVLREFVPPPEIKEIVNKNINDEEFENSIRMFVLLSCGEQRLITFTTPKEDCTIQEILEQVGVAVEAKTRIAINEINKDGINIVVSVGYDDDDDEDDLSVSQNGKVSSKSVARNPSPTPSPEPAEEPAKLIPGMMAVCTHCGFLSEDFSKCQRCRRKLPESIKAVPSKNAPAGHRTNANKKPSIEINLKPRPAQPTTTLNTSTSTTSSGEASPNTVKPSYPVRKKVVRPKLQDAEPMVVTLSSDDEDDSSGDKPDEVAPNHFAKEPSNEFLKAGLVQMPKGHNRLACTTINCRNIRIGSYRYTPSHDVIVNNKEMMIKLPHLKKEESVSVAISRKHVLKVLVNYNKALLAIFVYILPQAAEKICAVVGMTPDTEPFFDPVSDNEFQRRIILLPSVLKEEDKWALHSIYSEPTIIEELNTFEANAILMRSCNKNAAAQVALMANPLSTPEVRQLLIYPPGKGGISINTEDYMCLERDQFLNDVIIDFYLKYMVDQLPESQREKVQVFSTFFYTRLTTKPSKYNRKPTESEAALTPAQKRHARVKNWTKSIDLFEKDYIILPINENAHWFLAIICFPGMKGAQTFDGVSVKREHCKPIKRQKSNISKTTIPTVQIKTPKLTNPLDDIALDPDKDEAEGDDSEFEVDDIDESTPTEENMDEVPIKQPCILIFDSLAGAGRSRVVATLRDYLTCEYVAKKHEQFAFTKDIIYGACPKIPQQNNYTDCGLYLLQYVENFFKSPIQDYRIPIRGIKEWFDESVVTRKREDITLLIKSLMLKYQKDVSILPPIALPTQNGELIESPSDDQDDEEIDEAKTDEKIDNEMGISQDSQFANTPSSSSNCGSNSPGSESNSTPGKSSRQKAMSYLKAKRIIKTKAESSEEAKKMRMNE